MRIKILILFFMFFSISNAQMHPRMKERNRIEQLEKIKLIEELNLDEDASARLISRLTENRKKIREFMQKRMKLIREIEKNINDDNKKDNKYYDSKINSLLELEKEMLQEKEDFIKSLGDFLTPEQILRTMIFEVKFREEVKDALIRRERK